MIRFRRQAARTRPVVAIAANPHPLPSIRRVHGFYARALHQAFKNVVTFTEEAFASTLSVDVAINFNCRSLWERQSDAPFRVISLLNGGAVLDHRQLANWLPNIRPRDSLIASCRSDRDIIERLAGDSAPHTVVVPLPVDCNVFHPIHRDVIEDHKTLVVGFVGRLIAQKNAHRFLEMLAELRDRLSPRRVCGIVVGDHYRNYPVLNYVGNEYSSILQSIKERLSLSSDILFLSGSQKDDATLAALYSAMDILVHPTTTIDENFGFVPIEAMACETPVVGSAYGGLKDTVIDGKTGILVPTWTTDSGIRVDWQRMIDAAEQLLRDREMRRRYGSAARQHACDSYDYPRFLDKVVDIVTCDRTGAPPSAAPALLGSRRDYSAGPNRPVPGIQVTLPDLERGYDFYRFPIESYVSNTAPSITVRSTVRASAEFVSIGEGFHRLLDPAWPAIFRIDEALAQELHSATAVTVQRAAEVLGFSPGRTVEYVNGLIHAGIVAPVHKPMP